MSEAEDHDDPLDPAFIEQPGDREPEDGAGDDTQAAADAGDDTSTDDTGGDDTVAGGAGDDDTGDDASTGADAAGDDEPAKPKKDWRDRQIIKARAAEKKEREEKAALAAENAELKARLAGDGEATVLTTEERAKIRAEAAEEIRSQERFQKINQGSEAMFDAGLKAFPKTWGQRVADAAEVFSDEIRAKPEFLEAVTELDNSAAVYHELAGDPDKMEAVLNMPPHKMGMELARISARLATKAPKAISRAPAPIKPLDRPGTEERSLDDPNLSMDEFDRLMRIEEKKAYDKKVARGY